MGAASGVIGLSVDGSGHHPAAWREGDEDPRSPFGGAWLRARAQEAESAGFDLLVFPASHRAATTGSEITARLDAVQQAAFAAAVTTRIGIVPAVPIAGREPFHLAAQLATVDHASSGRAGLWALTLGDHGEEPEYSTGHDVPRDRRDAEAREILLTVRELWDSWEDGAIIREKSTGRYLDADRVHYVDHVGEFFSIKGPLITPRPPQGQLPIFGGPRLDAAPTDVVEVRATDPAAAITEARRLRAERGPIRLAVRLLVVLDARGRSASERLESLDETGARLPDGSPHYVGDVPGVLAVAEELLQHIDVLVFAPAVQAVDGDELRRLVLPALRRDAGAGSLRQRLGLAPAHNRYGAPTLEGALA